MSDALLQAILDELIKLNVSTKYLVKASPWMDGRDPLWALDCDQQNALHRAHRNADLAEAERLEQPDVA